MSFLLILILFLISLNNIISKKYFTKINSYESTINLIISGTSSQNLLCNDYSFEPSEVIINGAKKESCKKTCSLDKDINNVTLIFNTQIDSCQKMFSGLTNIKEIDLSKFDFSRVTSMLSMFDGCSGLEKISFGNIDTSSVNDMNSLFYDCSKLTSIDVSNFDTSKVTDMIYMFYGCSALTHIDVSNFNTKEVISIRSMFTNCKQLKVLNLSNFDTSKITEMSYLFKNCNNLLYLDLSNFDTSQVTTMDEMFCECNSLIFLNINSFKINGNIEKYRFNYNVPSYIKYCIKDQTALSYLLGKDETINCNDNCFDINYKIDISNNACIESCSVNLYEYSRICFDVCPEWTFSNNNKHICVDYVEDNILTTELINEKIVTEEIIHKNVITTDIIENNIQTEKNIITEKVSNKNIIITTDIIQENIRTQKNIIEDTQSKNNKNSNTEKINIASNIMSDYFDDINDEENKKSNEISINSDSYTIIDNKDDFLKYIINLISNKFNTTNVDNGIDEVYNQSNVIYTITSTKNQRNNINNENTTSIDLFNCEYKLKEEYKISQNSSLYVLKVDAFLKESKIPKIEYEVFYPFNNNKMTRLNLSICHNIKIDLYIPVNISSEELFKHDPKSDLYNNICHGDKNENSIDRPIINRRQEFVDNGMYLCEEDCDLKELDNVTKKVRCNCYTKIKLPFISEIKINKQKLLSNFKNIKNIANFNMIKCYYLLLDKKNILNNAANYILVFHIALSIFSIIMFACHDIKMITKTLMKIININKTNNIKINNINKISKNKKIIRRPNKMKINKNSTKNALLKNSNPVKKGQKKLIKINKPKNNNNKKNQFININLNNFNYNRTKINTFELMKTRKKNGLILKNNSGKNKINKTQTLKYNDRELNSLNYESALKIDKRSYCQYYISLLKTKHILIFTFMQFNDYNSKIIKVYIFFFTFAINFAVSAMFYSEFTMSKIYKDEGSFDITYQLPKMFYSLIITAVLKIILNFFGLYENNILIIKQRKNIYNRQDLNKYKRVILIKITLFFIITYIILIFVWVFLGCFCAVYNNTQIHLILDVTSSFALSFITPLFLYILPGIFRICSLKNKKHKKPSLYKIAQFLQFL